MCLILASVSSSMKWEPPSWPILPLVPGSQFEHPCGFGGNNRIFPGPGSPATALLSMDSMMETGTCACKDCVLPLSDVPRI